MDMSIEPYGPTPAPRITGLQRVSGRNDMTCRRRAACDLIYARNTARTPPAVAPGRVPADRASLADDLAQSLAPA